MVTVSVSVERTMPRFWVAMRLMRALEESAERSTMRLGLGYLGLEGGVSLERRDRGGREGNAAGAKGEEDQGAGDDCLDAGEKLRGHAAAGAGVQPTAGDDLEGGALLREYPLSMYSSFATAEPWYLI